MPPLQPAAIARHAGATVALNTVIAVFLSTLGHDPFGVNLLYSQLIGLGIWAAIDGGRFLLHPTGWPGALRMTALVIVSVPLAYALGSALANLLLGRPPLLGFTGYPRATLGLLLMSLVAGAVGTYYYTSREMLARARRAEQAAQRQATEARLRLLESQLEPHMLFNTLANLRALIATDPPRAIDMLDRLNAFLRATLAASRAGAGAALHTLQDEFDRLADYLALMAVRMGPRLRVRLELPDDLAALPLPPLLLQPLVENAIRHGLEPSTRGGEVAVVARRDQNTLVLTVQDDGVGASAADFEGALTDTPGRGFGLTQVRERLLALHGTAARLQAHSQPGEGTRISLFIPITP